MSRCPSICEDCDYNENDNWCEKYDAPCEDCYKNCKKKGSLLSGDDIEDQDDFMAWNTFCR